MTAPVTRFGDATVAEEDLREMVGAARRNRGPVAELFAFGNGLSGRPARSVASLGVLAESELGRRFSTETVRIIRDWFIGLLDRQLQDLYRLKLGRELPSQSTHDDRLAVLQSIRDVAFRRVRGFDWDWLCAWLELDQFGEDSTTCLRRLSNFAFPLKRVNFRFTYHCNIVCSHCYNTSGPTRASERIPLTSMLDVIAEMPGVGIPALNLTGGEPFLYADDVMRLVRAGRDAGLAEISIYTNGFWASTPARAEAMLGRLRAAGFMETAGDYLKVSSGIYHEEFIDFDRTLVLAAAYGRMFGRPLAIDVELPADDRQVQEVYRARVARAGLAQSARLSFRRVLPLGRGRDLPAHFDGVVDSPCGAVDQIVFDPDGAVRPCCGLNSENQGIRIGKLGYASLRDLVKSMQNDPVLQFISRNAMSELLPIVGVARDPATFVGHCDLCQTALGGLSDKAPLQSRLGANQAFYPFWFDAGEVSESQ